MSVTKRQAESVLAAARKQFKPWVDGGDGPELRMDFDWFGDGPGPAIVWEGGPFQWTTYFPHGGIEEEFGSELKSVELPDGVWVEAITGWATAVLEK